MNITNSINILELINKTYEFKNKITELIEQIKKYRECRNEFNELIEQIKKNYELKNKINKLQINNHTAHKESSNTINYSKSVIYKIEHIEKPELLYVGSTIDFNKRKKMHESDYKNKNGKQFNIKLYQMIRYNGNWESFKMTIIKKYPCSSKTELLIEEEKYRQNLQATLNSHKAYITNECFKENAKQYYKNNKENIQNYQKIYRQTNKEQIKKYKEDNKEYIKEQHKKYQEKNKEYI